MKALNAPSEEFLRPFFDVNEKVCLRIFSDRKDNTFKGQKFEIETGKIGSIFETLRKHNEQNRGVFFTVNYGGHSDEEITRINAQFFECDNATFEEQLDRIKQFSIEPSLIVKTRKSLHVYFLIKNGKIESFRRIQRKLAIKFEGDLACINESRVLRLPGFFHCKEEPIMVECIKFNPELRYTQEEIEKILPRLKEEEKIVAVKEVKNGTLKGLVLAQKTCEFLKHCKDNADKLSEHDWYAMITNLAVFEGGINSIHYLSKPYPKYDESETTDKINHFLDSGTKPITCKTIAEKGFKCPKLIIGECNCKSPAAIAYRPPSVDSLKTFLKEYEPTGNMIEDLNLASDFITQYLFNTDAILSEPFIDSFLKEHFNLNSPNLKLLLKHYKGLFKSNKVTNKKLKVKDNSEALAEWYEPNENGGMRFLPGVLATNMAKNLNAFYGAESYYLYRKGVYSEVNDLVASCKVREHLIDRYATMSGINDALGQWRMLIYRPIKEINCNPFIINVKNGLYNVLDDTFKQHTPDYLSTVQINASYDPSAKAPRFIQFIKELLHDEEIFLIQEIFGYLLIPIAKAQKSFVFVGPGNAGKSTLLSVAQEILLGSDNVSNIPWQSLGDRFKTAELFGKLANIFADLPSKHIDDNGLFKSITGEDYITVERKTRTHFPLNLM